MNSRATDRKKIESTFMMNIHKKIAFIFAKKKT